MNPRIHRSRLVAAACVIGSVAGGPTLTLVAHAQTVASGGDPPARVGRLARITGAVSFHAQGADHWDPATLNYPITSGDAFWTQPGAQAEIEVSGTRVVLNGQTELDVDSLDDRTLAATEPQGEAYVRVRRLAPGETVAIGTPRGVATLRAPGRYDVVAGDAEHPTSITVLEGAAEVTGNNLDLSVAANQSGVISGTDNLQAQVQPAQPDAFVTAQLDRERPPPRQAAAPPAVIAAMSGGEDLDAYGTWQSSPQVRGGLVSAGRAGLGAVPTRPLGLCRSLGLDVGRRRALGVRAVPLRPLGVDRRALGLGAVGLYGCRRSRAGLRAGPGEFRRCRQRAGGRRGAGGRRRTGRRLAAART